MIETVLADLKSRFGEKVLLSPEDIAPIIARSPAVQANMRSQGRFPIPIKKMGSKVGITIYHLAEYLANGDVKVEVKPIDEVELILNKTTSKRRKNNRDWLTAFQMQNNFNDELFVRVEKLILEEELNTSKDSDLKKDTKKIWNVIFGSI